MLQKKNKERTKHTNPLYSSHSASDFCQYQFHIVAPTVSLRSITDDLVDNLRNDHFFLKSLK